MKLIVQPSHLVTISRLILAATSMFAASLCSASSVRWEGFSATELNRLSPDAESTFKEQWAQSTVDEWIRRLMKLDGIDAVEVFKKNDGTLLFRAQRRQRIRQIIVNGNRHFGDNEIINQLGFKTGEPAIRKKIIEAAEGLKEYLGNRGYFNAEIEISFIEVSPSQVDLLISVDEQKPCRISDIEWLSDNPDLSLLLRRELSQYKGENFTPNLISELELQLKEYLIKRQYWATRVVQDQVSYNADRTEAKLSYRLTSNYKVDIDFIGNSFFSDSDLKQLLRDQPDLNMAADIHAKIESIIVEAYHGAGFLQAQIHIKQTRPRPQVIHHLDIEINEGKRIRWRKLDIIGRVSRPITYYRDVIINQGGPVLEAGYINQNELKQGVDQLINELRNNGYLRAEQKALRVDIDSTNSSGNVTLILDEGPLTNLKAINFTGNLSFSELELQKIMNLRPQTALRLKDLDTGMDLVEDFYRNNGFLEMRILNRDKIISYNASGTEATVQIELAEGPQIFVEQIVVIGNTFTKDHVILNEIQLRVGDLVTPEAMEVSVTRLRRMGIFSSVEMDTVEANTPLSRRTLRIRIREDLPGLWRFGAGINNERDLTFRGYLGLGYNNLFGTARALSGRVEANSSVNVTDFIENRITASYLEPFLFGQRLRGRVNLVRSQEIFDVTESVATIQESSRIDFIVESQITQHLTVGLTLWSLDVAQEFQHPTTRANFEPTTQQIGSIGPNIDLDYTDSLFAPTRGQRFNLRFEYADPKLGSSSLIQFYKTEAAASHYWPIWGQKLRWQNQVRGGFVNNVNSGSNTGIPTKRAFFLGGQRTLRGFNGRTDFERVPNATILPTQQGGNEIIINESSTYYLLKSEVQYIVWDPFGWVVFYDGGAVLIDGIANPRPYRDSVGSGVRFFTPFGAVSLDVGFKIDPEENERDFDFHFYIGSF